MAKEDDMTATGSDGHPDEGLIHAWLDGALGDDESQRIANHVGACAECSEVVAEARGLIAGASRVVAMLDETPLPRVKAVSGSGSAWRMLRVTPTRAAIAAALIVAVGVTLTRGHVLDESRVMADSRAAVAVPSQAQVPMQDSVLKSAVAKRVAQDQPPRTVEAQPSPAVTVMADVPVSPATVADPLAADRVAAARNSFRMQSETTSARADRARVGFEPSAPSRASAVASAKAAEGVGAQPALMVGAPREVQNANSCYRIEGGGTGAKWGTAALPVILAFDSTGHVATVFDTHGKNTEQFAVVERLDTDSLVLRLRRIGYKGTMALAAAGAQRGGEMRSSPETMRLEEVVVAPAAPQARQLRKSAPAASVAGSVASSFGAAVSITSEPVACSVR